MKYLILIYSNAASREIWEGLSDVQRVEFGRGHVALTEALAESGELIVSEELADPSLAKRVSVREGQTMTTDGPFARSRSIWPASTSLSATASSGRSSTPGEYRTPPGARLRCDRFWISADWSCEHGNRGRGPAAGDGAAGSRLPRPALRRL